MRRRYRGMLLPAVLALTASACAAAPQESAVSGRRALAHTRKLVGFGPRVPGSAAHKRAQAYIESALRKTSAEVETVEFVARTPGGAVPMKNFIGKFPGESKQIVVIASHYDTLKLDGFVGANDGASSTGLLLELAQLFGQRKNRLSVWVVFFDGEEAFVRWTDTDSTYGSREQAVRWQRDGTLGRIRALILLDMVGDKNLNFRRDVNSTRWLTDLVWQVAREKGYEATFTRKTIAINDDHLPFTRAGVPAVDLIDFDYGPGNRYWHTPQDTLDKLSARSLQVVGEVVVETVNRLDQVAGNTRR